MCFPISRNAILGFRKNVQTVQRPITLWKVDCLRRPTLTDCNSPEGDSAVKGFAIVPYIQGIAKPIIRVLNKARVIRAIFFSRRQRNGSDFIALPARVKW